MMRRLLWHFTNRNGHEALQSDELAVLMPSGDLGLVWMTVIGVPVAATLGLLEEPEKLQYRYCVDTRANVGIRPWREARDTLPMEQWWMLEREHSDPLLWYVSSLPVFATYEPSSYKPMLHRDLKKPFGR